MTSAITPTDRALIDAAIAAGRVQRIPEGVYGIDIVTREPWPDIDAAIRAHRAWIARMASIKPQPPAPMKRTKPKVRKTARAHEGQLSEPRVQPQQNDAGRAETELRNQQIARLYAAGLPYQQIGAHVGMSKTGVYRICHEKLLLPNRSEKGL